MKKAGMAAALALVAGCGGGGLAARPFALEWRARPVAVMTSDGLRTRPVRLDPFADRRPDPFHVGWERGAAIRTPENVAAFTTQAVAQVMQGAGVSLVAQGETVVLHGEIMELDVTETHIYNATVRLRIVAMMHGATGDTAIADATYDGASRQWGRGHNAAGVNQALSTAIVDATRRFLQDPQLSAAIMQATGGPVMGAPVLAAPSAH